MYPSCYEAICRLSEEKLWCQRIVEWYDQFLLLEASQWVLGKHLQTFSIFLKLTCQIDVVSTVSAAGTITAPIAPFFMSLYSF